MCICWCVTEINYRMHGATIKIFEYISSLWCMQHPARWAKGITKITLVFLSFLDVTFPNRWIERDGPIPWPPRSPDIIPLHFFLWGVC